MSKLTELYATSKGTSYQCELTNAIVIRFKDYEWQFNIADFLVFRKNIQKVDLKQLIFNLSDECDYVSLQYAKLPSEIRLNLCDCIQLKELIDGTKFSLELVAMIHEILGNYEVI